MVFPSSKNRLYNCVQIINCGILLIRHVCSQPNCICWSFFHAYMTGQVDILLKWVISVIYIRALRQIKDNKHDKHILLHLWEYMKINQTASSIDKLSRSIKHAFTNTMYEKKNYQKILKQVLKITATHLSLWTKIYEILKHRVFALREKCTHW